MPTRRRPSPQDERAARQARRLRAAAQLATVEQALLQGAGANGFDTDLWTLERIAVVITQLTGVRYHPGHVWSILRQRTRRAGDRPLGGPRVAEDQKGAAAKSAWIVFFDESARHESAT
jgi:hypothetical protein